MKPVLPLAAILTGLFVLLAPPATASDAPPPPPLEKGEFDPAAWDALLARFVNPDGVDYGAWKKAGTGELDAFLDAAAAYDLTSILGKEPRAAFLINAYNAWAVRQVLERYPVESPSDIPGFFAANRRKIAGEERSLDEIEAALAAMMKHAPVTLFTLASGARGAPPLAAAAYRSANLAPLALETASRFLKHGAQLRYDAASKTLHMPAPMEKYQEIFDAAENGLASFLVDFMSLSDIMAISQEEVTRVFDPVDGRLADAPRAAVEPR